MRSFCTGRLGRSVTQSALPAADVKTSFYLQGPQISGVSWDAPSYLLHAGSGHFGIRSTIEAVFPTSQLKARSVLDLIPAPIFFG